MRRIVCGYRDAWGGGGRRFDARNPLWHNAPEG